MQNAQPRSRRTRKIAAIAAGALVVGVGATYTLASWNDAEWVWGGANADQPGVGTDSFNIVQNTTSPFADDVDNWVDEENNPGGELTFTAGALSLTPGDSIYAPVALKTDEGSLGAEVTLQAAVAADDVTAHDKDDKLWDAIQVAVYSETVKAAAGPTNTCDADNIGDWGTALDGITSLDDVATEPQDLTADEGSNQHYCFVLSLPDYEDNGSNADALDALQGRTIAPAWKFAAESVVATPAP